MADETWTCGGCGQEVSETHYRWEDGTGGAIHVGGPKPESIEDAEANLIYTVEEVSDPEPVAPLGVVIHFRSGESQKVELVYRGVDTGGLHIWEVTTHPWFHDVESVTVDVMPPKTMIHLGGPGGP